METNPLSNAFALTLSDGVKPSDNVGSDLRTFSEHGGFRNGSGENGEQRESVVNSSQLIPEGWVAKFGEATSKAIQRAKEQSTETRKPWTLVADQYTKNVLADCPERKVSAQTERKYRAEFSRLDANGQTAFEKANSVQHWNLLRTASRFCLETDIKRLRAESEKARREKNIPLAQEKNEQAFRLAIILNEQFLKIDHPTWANKKIAMAQEGKKPVNKSKRNTKTPGKNIEYMFFASKKHKKNLKIFERHLGRLAVIALTGCRPAELMKGIEVASTKNGGLAFKIIGAKCDDKRGQSWRHIGVKANCSISEILHKACQQAGGRMVITTTEADYRSLNRALQAHGLSCYSFRHAFGTQVKNAMAENKMTPQQGAQAMGHAGVKSVTYYGRTTRRRGLREITVKASREVKARAVTRKAKLKKVDWKNFRFDSKPAEVQEVHHSCGVKLKIPSSPKPPS